MRGIESAGSDSTASSRGIPISTAAPRVRVERNGGEHRLGPAGRLDRVVDAAAVTPRGRPRPSPRRCPPRARRPSRRTSAPTSSFARRRVDGDHRLGADCDGGHQRRQADAAAADHGDPVAGPHAGGAPDGADPGRDRAARRGRRRRTGRRAGSGRSERSGTTQASANVERNE